MLNTQASLPNPFLPAFGNGRGLRLVATEVEWTHGDGPSSKVTLNRRIRMAA